MTSDRLRSSFLVSVILFLIHSSFSTAQNTDDYFKQRRKLIEKSRCNAIGGNVSLNDVEREANRILMKYKMEEFDNAFKDSGRFDAGMHFFQAKQYIQETCVFKIIQKLPKGASLHCHDTAMVCEEFVFYNITYRENLYARDNEDGQIDLKFFKNDPGVPWMLVSQWRELDNTFNSRLTQQMTLCVPNPEVVYPDIGSVWTKFQKIFSILRPMLTYKPVFRDYFYQALNELYEDNIRYLEFRGLLPTLYDLDGRTYGPEDVVQLYYETSRDFMKDHPDFWGVKLIFAPSRYTTEEVVEGYVQFIANMNRRFPGFLAGFDLVGREDTGPPLKDFVPALLKMKSITDLFFHAGETFWTGEPSDLNLFDAILLNTSRIGHGYSVIKHSEVLKAVKEQNIALEISPISNQVLGLVKDLRNHPANFLIANNYPLVITQDDPGFWGAKGVSFDWYYAFMAMSSRESDLRLLKQLALNSIVYSRMEEDLRKNTLAKWEDDWKTFLKEVIKGNITC